MLTLVLVLTACTPRQDTDELLNLPLPSQSCSSGEGAEACVVDTERGTLKRIRASGLQPNSEVQVALTSNPLSDPGRKVRTARVDKQGRIAPVKDTEFRIPGTTFVLLKATSAHHVPVVFNVVVTTFVPPRGQGPG